MPGVARRYKMVDSKSEVTIRTDVTNLYDTATQNCIRILDELTKAQQQYKRSLTNLQHDYVVAVKNTIQNMVSVQKMLATSLAYAFLSITNVPSSFKTPL